MTGQDRTEALAAAYTAARPRLVRIAYAVVGSQVEAEDVVSDTWLRLVDADAGDKGPVLDVDAWATVAVARRALDVLRSARVRRESYIGPWLPEPVVGATESSSAAGPGDPADRVTLDETVSFALLVVLESLTPAERTAWVLHDVFGMPFAEVAHAVGRTPAAVRQLAVRARAHVRDHAPRASVNVDEHKAVVAAFARAAATGDVTSLAALLDPAIVLTSDGGGQVRAARRPVVGADRVARFLSGLAAKAQGEARLEMVTVNGDPGVAVLIDGQLIVVGALTIEDKLITRIDMVMAPDKLRAVHL